PVVIPVPENGVISATDEHTTPGSGEKAEFTTVESVPQKETYFDSFGWIHERYAGRTENHAQGGLSPIEKDKVVFYIDRINQYLLRAPYTDPGFDMKTISEALQYPLYHIEYLFRYYNQYSFPEFRNIM